MEDDDEEDGETNTKLYVPPRVVAMPYGEPLPHHDVIINYVISIIILM